MKTLEQLLAQTHISPGDIRYMSPTVKAQIISATGACTGSIRERLHWIHRGLNNYPSCTHCQRELSSKNFSINVRGGIYSRYCSARCAASCERVTAKKINTNRKKYGSDYYLGSSAARNRIKQTNIERYGTACPHPWSSDRFTALILKKYGTDRPSAVPGRSKKITRSIIASNIDSGKTFSSIRTCEIRHNCVCVNSELAFDYNRDILENITFRWKHAECGKEYPSRITDGDITVCPSCHSTTSSLELSLRGMIIDLAADAQFKVRGLISRNREFDIFVPSKNIAVEFNGIYWHSALRNTNKNYHLDKTHSAEQAGIRLIHIWENDFLQKYAAVRSALAHALGQTQIKISARDCAVREVTHSAAKKFFAANSMSHDSSASVNIGLFWQDQLVQIMSFSRCKFKKYAQWQTVQLVSALDTAVRGGASRLFTYFIRNWQPTSVLATSDRCLSTGAVWNHLGFRFIKNSAPDYFWASTSSSATISRARSEKSKLNVLLGAEFDNSMSQSENMKRVGWFKLWNCGKSRWLWTAQAD